MKNKILLFLTGAVFFVLSSCLNSDDTSVTVSLSDAQIASFKLANDSIEGIGDVVFTIDQIEGRIFNQDSMPFGTEINELLVMSLTYTAGGVYNVNLTPEATGETYQWNGTDSVDFSEPVRITVTAYDGITTKNYLAQINIHTVVPDSMTWGLLAENVLGIAAKEQKVIPFEVDGVENYLMYVQPSPAGNGYQLYSSSVNDLKSWSQLSLNGLPESGLILSQITAFEGELYVPATTGILYRSVDGRNWFASEENTPNVKALLGVVREGLNQPAVLATIIEEDGNLYFAGMNESQGWISDPETSAVPAGFPLTGFGSISYQAMYFERLMVAGGKDTEGNYLNSSWGTMGNATTWILLTDEKSNYFEKRSGAMLAKYDDMFFLMGGH
ncbi:MAG: DUF5018 domain-containing protein [Tannerellaceae bacterium]|nr:DUF5018 domain-containing protein [Tannerellaceae bacterium]